MRISYYNSEGYSSKPKPFRAYYYYYRYPYPLIYYLSFIAVVGDIPQVLAAKEV